MTALGQIHLSSPVKFQGNTYRKIECFRIDPVEYHQLKRKRVGKYRSGVDFTAWAFNVPVGVMTRLRNEDVEKIGALISALLNEN